MVSVRALDLYFVATLLHYNREMTMAFHHKIILYEDIQPPLRSIPIMERTYQGRF